MDAKDIIEDMQGWIDNKAQPGFTTLEFWIEQLRKYAELEHHCKWLVSGAVISGDDSEWPAQAEALSHIESWVKRHGVTDDDE